MSKNATLRIGVDTGGTFTDIVLDAGNGSPFFVHKVSSSTGDPSHAVLAGIRGVLEKLGFHHSAGGAETSDALARVVHGSTVATNALLEGKGGRTALISTSGFEDLLVLGRQNRPELYELEVRKPRPPIPRSRCIAARERMRYDGTVIIPLAEPEVDDICERIAAMNIEAVAVCLLHSYANPEHENRIANALRERLPGVHITVSSDLLPEFREYERTATCVVNAVVAPPMVRYVEHLEKELGRKKLQIMSSSGGTQPVESIVRAPIQTILSGPAGGVIGALASSAASQIKRIITLDMGGTSTDVALCDGVPMETTEMEVAGLPVRLPAVDIHTVGAGGGSVAWIDTGGALRVGPHSTGADPGPACYGRQSDTPIPTVTDAHVVLGHIESDAVLGDDLKLNTAAAFSAVGRLADQLAMDVGEAASGILRVAEATMARALQRISMQRGRDPRGYTLVPFGGAGGLHGCRLAENLGMKKVLFPVTPGLLSAFGMLSAGPLYNFSQGLLLRVQGSNEGHAALPDLPEVKRTCRALEAKAKSVLERDGVDPLACSFEFSLDLRYEGQSFELNVVISEENPIEEFRRQHERLYGYTNDGAPLDLVAVRLKVRAPTQPLAPRSIEKRRASNVRLEDLVTYRNGFKRAHRDHLLEGDCLDGPVVIREYSATAIVPRGWQMSVDEFGQVHVNNIGR